MNIFKIRKIALTLLYIGILLMFLGYSYIIFLIIGIIFVGAFIILSYLYWRCPKCKHSFPIRHSVIDNNLNCCPYCKENIRAKIGNKK